MTEADRIVNLQKDLNVYVQAMDGISRGNPYYQTVLANNLAIYQAVATLEVAAQLAEANRIVTAHLMPVRLDRLSVVSLAADESGNMSAEQSAQ